MEYVEIVSKSWPLAAVAIVFMVSIGVYAIISRIGAREDRRVRKEQDLQIERELDRRAIAKYGTVGDRQQQRDG